MGQGVGVRPEKGAGRKRAHVSTAACRTLKEAIKSVWLIRTRSTTCVRRV